MNTWTLFSNHGHVLFCLARNPEARLRDVAADVGITERAVQKIVRDLQDSGMVSITKTGRRNSYQIDTKKTLRHKLEAASTLKDLIKVVNKDPGPARLPAAEVKVTERPLPGNYEPPEIAVKSASASAQEKRPAQSAPVTIAPQEKEPKKAAKNNPDPSDSKERKQGSLF